MSEQLASNARRTQVGLGRLVAGLVCSSYADGMAKSLALWSTRLDVEIIT
jgi:hypothetical protein